MSRLRGVPLVVAGARARPAAAIGEGPAGAPTVLFSPGMQEALDTPYGGSEGAALRQTIREGVGAALRGTGCGGVPQVEITLVSARLLDPAGRALKSLRYDWYAQDARHGSRAAEPWGDVELASEGLGSQLARACRALAHSHATTP